MTIEVGLYEFQKYLYSCSLLKWQIPVTVFFYIKF